MIYNNLNVHLNNTAKSDQSDKGSGDTKRDSNLKSIRQCVANR